MTNLEELRVKPELAREVERLARELDAAGSREQEASAAFRAVYTEYEKARNALVEHILCSLNLKSLPYDVLARLGGPDEVPF